MLALGNNDKGCDENCCQFQLVSVQHNFVYSTSTVYIQLNNTGHIQQSSTVKSIQRYTVSIHVFLQRGQCPCGVWEACSLLGDEWPHSVSLCFLGSNRGHWVATITFRENQDSCDTFAFNGWKKVRIHKSFKLQTNASRHNPSFK